MKNSNVRTNLERLRSAEPDAVKHKALINSARALIVLIAQSPSVKEARLQPNWGGTLQVFSVARQEAEEVIPNLFVDGTTDEMAATLIVESEIKPDRIRT